MEVLEGASSNVRSHISSSNIYIQKDANFRDVPLCIEPILWRTLSASNLSHIHCQIMLTLSLQSSGGHLHLAAVYANNFANFMVNVTQESALDNGIDPGMLVPLSSKRHLIPQPAMLLKCRQARRSVKTWIPSDCTSTCYHPIRI